MRLTGSQHRSIKTCSGGEELHHPDSSEPSAMCEHDAMRNCAVISEPLRSAVFSPGYPPPDVNDR